jgi:hypothetical protein
VKVGDLIKHCGSKRTAIILDINMLQIKGNHEAYAKLLFSHETFTSQAPLKILQDCWEVLSEVR